MPLFLTNKTLSEYQTINMSDNPEQGNKNLAQAQAQVGEVVDIMRVNVEKVLERDSKLSELDQRADNLQEGASQFQTQVGLSRIFYFLPFQLCSVLKLFLSFAGNKAEEEILVAEHEDDDDHWCGGGDLVDHHHSMGLQRVTLYYLNEAFNLSVNKI